MPEIGQAFGIAKDVFMKNLLWPLRQQIMPLLQKMLDWVRDNRARFVQWGATIGNIFRTILIVAKNLWAVFKGLVDVISNAFQKAFKTNFKSFDEFLNVLSFKISAVIIYLGMLAKDVISFFKPLIDSVVGLGVAFGKVAWDALGSFFGGLSSKASGIGSFRDAIKGFTEALTKFFGDPAVQKAIKDFTSFLGAAIGTGLTDALRILADFLNIITSAIRALNGEHIDWGKVFGNLGSDLLSAGGDITKGIADIFGFGEKKPYTGASMSEAYKFAENPLAYKKPTSVHDAIITKTGQIINTDPDDNLIATKKLSLAGMRSNPISVTMSNIFNVSVNEGDAERTGASLGSGLARGFRERILMARTAEGL
jgi:hypothetical protein